MKTIILVWGAAKRGKSESIKELATVMPFCDIIRPWHNGDKDSYVIGKVKDKTGKERIVGIENQGDPGSSQKQWIEACVNAGCEIIVAASRTYGKTYEDAYQIAHDNGYEVVEVTTLFHRGGPSLPNGTDLRTVFAENLLNLVWRCLD